MCCCKPTPSHSDKPTAEPRPNREGEAPGSVEALTARVAQLEAELRNRGNG
jgi:hypothetical protein